MSKNKISFRSVVLLAILFLSGCSFEDGKEKVTNLLNSGKEKIEETMGESDEKSNPAFADATEAKINLEVGVEMNEYLKRNFAKVFDDTKIVETGQLRNTPFTFQYVMKKRFSESDLENLMAKFLETGSFTKDDAPINRNSGNEAGQFGLYHNFGGRQYVLEFLFDYGKQLVWVNIY